MDDTASEHGSLADSSYDIVSHSGTIDEELGVAEDNSTSSFPNSRALTPALSFHVDDDEDYQYLHSPSSMSKLEQSQHLDDTPLASLRLPRPDTCTVHCTQADALLELDRPFRIRYHGVPADRDAVIGKIAQALALSCPAGSPEESALRYSVSQLSSFGAEKEAPQIELVPHTGIEIVLESHERPASSLRSDKSGPNSKDKFSHTYQALPDLIVFLHAKKESESLQVNTNHEPLGAPCLHLSETFYDHTNLRPYSDALYMKCDDHKTLMDLQHFLGLDALALNRHIAHLVLNTPTSDQGKLTGTLAVICDTAQSFQQMVRGQQSVRQALAALLAVTMITALVLSMLTLNHTLAPPEQPLSSFRNVEFKTQTKEPANVPMAAGPKAPPALTDSEWFGTPAPALSTMSQSTIIVLDTENTLGQGDPPVELLHVKDWLYYLKMPNELAKPRRVPQLKVTASSQGKAVDLSLAKWNATVYSLELQPNAGSGPIDVFVSFGKGTRLYMYKVQPASSWLAMKRLHSWVDQKTIESGIAACMATSKELSRMASKEVSHFRDHANDLAVSSSRWLHKSMSDMQKTSKSTAVELWRGFELQTTAVTRALQVYNDDFSRTASKQTSSITKAISEQAKGLARSGGHAERTLHEAQQTLQKRIGMLQRRLRGVEIHRNDALKIISVAQARAKAIAEDLKARIIHRYELDAKHERKAHRKSKKPSLQKV